jgi:hypothetical protein
MAGPQPALTPATTSPVHAAVLFPSPGASAADIHGQPANPAHGQWTWEDPAWLPHQVIPHMDNPAGTVQTGMINDDLPNAMRGADPEGFADPTSTGSHGAPWPRSVNPDAQWDAQVAAAQQELNASAHGFDSGDPAAFTVWLPPTSNQVGWTREHYVSDGTSGMEQVPGQLQGNANTGFRRDTGWFVDGESANRFGQSGAHVDRYRATGDMPVPPNSTHGAQRPLEIQPASRRSYPVGAGSPFEGQTPGWYGMEGVYADQTGFPTDYQASPDPVTVPAYSSANQPAQPPAWGLDFLG